MPMRTKEQQGRWYGELFREFERSLNGESERSLHQSRIKAMEHFATTGFPSAHDEEWRYTDVSRIASMEFRTATGKTGGAVAPSLTQRFTLGMRNYIVVIDGRFAPEHSRCGNLPAGIRVEGLANALRETPGEVEQHLAKYVAYAHNPFAALGTAFLHDGVYISVPDRTVVDEPIHIVCLSTQADAPTIMHPRILVVAGNRSQLRFLESYASLGGGATLTNTTTEVVVGDDAIVEHAKLQREHDAAYHVATVHIQQGRNSRWFSTNITLGGALTRNTITAVLGGEGSEAILNGLYIAADTETVDNHTAIDHAQPHCESHELYKGILGGRSRGVFNGKIIVRKDAQKTDAKQTNKNLLLSDEASIDTKPQLEIFANDVKCTHGATIGQLDEEAIFYLRSRGLGDGDARNMLIAAFAADVTDRINAPSVREACAGILQEHLP